MKNNVKKSLNILQKMYMSGLIPYPRVSNDFEKNPTFELFPHPPLPIIENFNEPFKTDTLQINKKSSLLLLSLFKLTKPSNLEKISEKIDYFFDDELNFVNDDIRKEYDEINSFFNSFLTEQSLTEKELLGYANSFYSKKNKEQTENELSLFHIKQGFFYNSKEDKKEKNKYIFFKKKKKNIPLDKEVESTSFIDKEFKSLSDLVAHIRKHKNDINNQISQEKESLNDRINS